MLRDEADPVHGDKDRSDAGPREFLQRCFEGVFEHVVEHVLLESGIDPSDALHIAREIAVRASAAVGPIAVRGAARLDIARGAVGGMVQRAAVHMAHEMEPRLQEAARVGRQLVIPEREIADSFRYNLAQEIERLPQHERREPARGELDRPMGAADQRGCEVPDTWRAQHRESARGHDRER